MSSYPNPVNGPNSINADLGLSSGPGTMAGVGGSGLDGSASMPGDPMNFMPGPADNWTGMPDTNAPWGNSGHSTDYINP